MKRFALTILPLALAACVTLPAASATTGTPTAGFGQTANVGPLLVRPIALIEDSRCPINARCVWAGRLILRADVRGGGVRQIRNLTLGEPQPIAGGHLTLVAAEPGKLAGAEGNPPASHFTFEYGR